MELERRWEINKNNIPKESIDKMIHIQQVYSNFNPDVRIRCKNTKNKTDYSYSHTVKYFISNTIREEIEQDISRNQYNTIFDYIDKKPLEKDRYFVKLDNDLIAEVDDFNDVNKTIVEVEFSNINQMNNFIVPNWFGKEIKERKMYDYKIFTFINENKKKYISDLDMLFLDLT